jgi:predicted transposase YbfD/YdcC
MRKLSEYFLEIEDPREEHKCKHKLSDLLLIGLFTYLSNGEDYEDMVLFGATKGHLLKEYLSLPNGIPSHDTFNRIFQILDCNVLKKCLTDYGKELIDILSEKQICLDGKKLKGVSPTSRGNQGLYIVNAWLSENKLCIGQERVDDKSNEIEAIPRLLKEIDITDAVVSIDAIGCQKGVVNQIQEQGGHYLLAVKNNQKELYEDISCAFKANKALSVDEEWEYARGRFETRTCSILNAKSTLLEEVFGEWKGLQTLIKIEATRIIKEQATTQVRYYISDENEISANYFNRLTRGHWSIENHLHWHLDVTFREDDCRARKGNAPENLATLRKLALQIITEHDDKLSLKKRRVKAAFDIEYLKALVT